MEKKYQIFISSTYDDLKDEREQAIKAVLEMGHIPVGMEMFSAADEEQWQLIAKQIEETDYYVVVVGHRYGSETNEGISYTEKEYDYAVSNGVPILGFVIDDEAPWPKTRIDTNQKKKRKLEAFKSKVKGKLVNFWSNKEDLHGKISISLIKAMNTNPRIGWAKASEAIGTGVTKELSRLSTENSVLREMLLKLQKEKEEHPDEVRNVINIMYKNTRSYQVRETAKWEDAKSYKRTLLDMFLDIAPTVINERSSLEIAQSIAMGIVWTKHYKNWPIGKTATSELIADYVALDLIESSRKKHSVHDKDDYWSLTDIGKQVLKRARRIELEEGIRGEDEKGNKKENS